jgi:hypothetical protein
MRNAERKVMVHRAWGKEKQKLGSGEAGKEGDRKAQSDRTMVVLELRLRPRNPLPQTSNGFPNHRFLKTCCQAKPDKGLYILWRYR